MQSEHLDVAVTFFKKPQKMGFLNILINMLLRSSLGVEASYRRSFFWSAKGVIFDPLKNSVEA